jgi:hypothetical protein
MAAADCARATMLLDVVVGGWLDQQQGSERLSSGVGSIWYYHYRFVRTRVAGERERRLQRGATI